MEYIITYDYCDEYTDERGLVDTFNGTYTELMERLEMMRSNGCGNISVTARDENGEVW